MASESSRNSRELQSERRDGSEHPSDTAGIKDVVTKAVSYDLQSLTVSSKLTCECSDGSAVACTDTCSGEQPYAYVTVSVSKTYSSPLPTTIETVGTTTFVTMSVSYTYKFFLLGPLVGLEPMVFTSQTRVPLRSSS